MTTATTGTERFADETMALLDAISSGQWIPPGLARAEGLAPLDATMRPIDELPRAGLDWLTPHVQPLQAVLDRMAGKAGVIESFAEAWRQTGEMVEGIRDQFTSRVKSETAEWRGLAADRYRRRSEELQHALRAASYIAKATGVAARQMGEVVADARKRAGDLLTDLVQRLISYARQAIAVEGGVTPNVLAQCTSMINTYRGPITEIERKLQQALADIPIPVIEPFTPSSGPVDRVLETIITALGAAGPGRVVGILARAWRVIGRIFGRRGQNPPPTERPGQPITTRAQLARALEAAPRTRIGQVEPPTSGMRPGDNINNVMADRVRAVVQQRHPGVQFTRGPRRGAVELGPDMPVVPGRRDPGFDWYEIKLDSPHTMRNFSNQLGSTPAWSGRGRLVTWDRQGNVYEVQYPIEIPR